MKKYNLKISGSKLKKTGLIFFTYDKAFQGVYDKNIKYIPCKMSIDIYSGETSEIVIQDLKNRYKNPRDFVIKMIGGQNGSI